MGKGKLDLSSLALAVKNKLLDEFCVCTSVSIYKCNSIDDTYVMLVYIINSEDDLFQDMIYDTCVDFIKQLDHYDIILNVEVI